jgi:glyoxylate reductase
MTGYNIYNDINKETAMKEKKVYITRAITRKATDYLADQFSVEVSAEDRPLTREELLQGVRGKDAVLTMLNDKVDSELMDAAKGQIRIFANYAVGYNNIDVVAATERGIFISNTPDVLTDATADIAWSLLLAAARRIVDGDRVTRRGDFTGWSPLFMLGVDVVGKTIGIIGAGRIGQAVARRARGFDMKVIYTANNPRPEFERAAGAVFVDLDSLIKESDFISLHLPLAPATHHLLGAREFGMMKRTAVLVNTARGPIVDEKALADALRSGRIFAAGLDVYEREPEVEPELLDLDNVVLCPHLGSATFDTRDRMGIMAADNILAAMSGRVPPQCVNPEAAKNR